MLQQQCVCPCVPNGPAAVVKPGPGTEQPQDTLGPTVPTTTPQ